MIKQDSSLIHKALEWHATINSDAVTKEEQAAFQAWMADDPSHRRAFEEARRLWAGLAGLKNAPIEHLRAGEPRGRVSKRPLRFPFHNYTWALTTSCIATVLVIAASVLRPSDLKVSETLLETATAEVRTEVLIDGSAVTLGARSSISVKMTGTRRSVALLSGTAYFDVNQEIRPFSVASGGLRVDVTGTQFAVRRSSRGTQVAVAEGSVNVRATSSQATVKKLGRGQRIGIDGLGRFGDVRQIAPNQVAAWRRNRLMYDEAPLGELVADLDRYSDKPLQLLDARLASERITATFDATETELILVTLTELYPLDVVETATRTELRRRQ